ncbi:MAG: biotin--[acetyl-CoA-carboxylase] ligase [Chlorobiaceae bacterium]|nr:biotin--[acetyl-CoA-carboxylase] ligase [Chlorobiaceae bacterium]NTV16426.1 biotin--[acetyl-CoA-carboxylase] ligase [Chlorobiaceae bacterium]
MNDVTAQILVRLMMTPDFLSGESLCREFGITRSAVWKHIRLLRSEGYHLDAVTGRGYRLSGLTGRPVEAEVRPFLTARNFGCKLVYHTVTVSTNILAKVLAVEGSPEGTVVVADSQSGGRGRMGRIWVSPPGVNLYFSLILRPAVPSVRVPQLPLLVAVAIHQALSKFSPGLEATIKWPNDILVHGRKLCGVLCEMQSEPDLTHFVVTGIGINVNQSELPPLLQESATSLFLERGHLFSRPELLASILNHFEPLYDAWLLEEDLGFILPYLEEHSLLHAKEVTIDQMNRSISGTVRGISRYGELKLENTEGETILVSSGEAHLRKAAFS